MNKKLIIIGSILLIFGLIFSSLVLLLGDGFEGLEEDLISKTYEINGEFDELDLELEEADFNLYLSTDGTNKALCLEKENISFNVEVVNNTLKIKENNKKVIEFINISNPEISLFLTKNTFNKLNLNYDTGDIDIPDAFTFNNVIIKGHTGDINFMGKVNDNLDIELSTGNISVYKTILFNTKLVCSTGNINVNETLINGNLTTKVSTGKTEIIDTNINGVLSMKASTGKTIIEGCEIGGNVNVTASTGDFTITNSKSNSLTLKLTTGDAKLINYIAANDVKIETTTGKVSFQMIDGKNFDILTDTGDIEGDILTEKVFDVKSDTGSQRYPSTYSGGIFKVRTDTGEIDISLS